MAKLIFYHGIMSSGKTTDLIQTAYKYNSTGKVAVIVKPMIDTKGDNYVINRAGWKMPVDVLLKDGEDVFNYLEELNKATCILVDEAQFLTPKQVKEFYYITKRVDIPVLCYGLSKDFKGKLFPGSAALFQDSDVKTELKAVCATPGCDHTARYNARMINKEFVFDGEQVVIDDKDTVKYIPLCPECYIKYVLRPKSSEFQDMEEEFRNKVKILKKEN